MRAQDTGAPDTAAHLVRRHTLLHLDADLRWLDEAVDALSDPASPEPATADPSQGAR